MGYVRDKERERAVTIVKVWNVLSVVTIVSQIAFIILYCIGVLQSAKIVFFALGVLPWIRYLYGLIYSDITVWDELKKKNPDNFIRQSAYWHETHLSFFEGEYSWIQMLIFTIDLYGFKITHL